MYCISGLAKFNLPFGQPPKHTLQNMLTYQLLMEGETHRVERVARIELASLAWKAKVLPLHNTRIRKYFINVKF